MGPSKAVRGRFVRWLLRVGTVTGGLVLLLVGLLLMMEWRPAPIEATEVTPAGSIGNPASESMSLLSWNIGYAGLDRAADFFMDGGKRVRPPDRETVERNLEAISTWLAQNPADVVLLQEVDRNSSRTYRVDQTGPIYRALPKHHRSMALNFKVPWIPYPFSDPLGTVESGLLSLSIPRPHTAMRHQLPGSYGWPVRVFHLKRCLHELRFQGPDGKDWVVLHLHLSAFDQGGKLRQQQMDYLKKLMLRMYSEGHHVIAAGDWNQAFPGVADRQFPASADLPAWFQRVPEGWTPAGWRWAYDLSIPSLRATNRPYVPGENFTTIVDGFLVSPDLVITTVETVDLGFAHSDHHPVRLVIGLKKDASLSTSEPDP